MSTPRAVLHVEDDPQFVRLMGALLRSRGYEYTAVTDPKEGLPALMRSKCRVVLLDLEMPGMNGIELLTQIKKFDGGIQVIVLTGVVTIANTLQSMRRGAECCFFKPITDMRPLVEAIEAGIEKSNRWWNTISLVNEMRKLQPPVPTATDSPGAASLPMPKVS